MSLLFDRIQEAFAKKYLRNLGREELKQFDELVKSLEATQDPTKLGEFVPTIKNGKCFVARITTSFRLAYRVFGNHGIIQLVAIGDHKEIFGKDKHS